MRREKQFRGISVRLARNYLESLGGTVVDAAGSESSARQPEPSNDGSGDGTTVEGDGWRATLSAEQVDIGPSLELTEVTVVFEAEAGFGDDRFEELIEDFSRKAMRAGG